MQPLRPPQTAFAFIRHVIKPYRWYVAIMFLTAIVWAVDLSVRPYLLKIILNRIGNTQGGEVLYQLALPAASYFFMQLALSSAFRLYDYCVEYKMIPRLRKTIADTVFSYVLGHSHHYYQNNFSGSLANKINNLVSSVPDLLKTSIDRFFSHSLALTIGIYALWQVHIKFAFFMVVWGAFIMGVSLLLSKRFIRLSDAWSEAGSIITGKMVDVLSNILAMRLFTRRSKERDVLNESFQRAVQAEQKLEWMYFLLWCSYGYSLLLLQGLCLYFLIQGRQQGMISVGDFALVLTLNHSIGDFMWHLAKDFSQFSKDLGRITQALRVTTEPLEIQDKPEAASLTVKEGRIVFDKVRFRYRDAEALFQDKSVTIPAGQKVGLVGYSGSGKSTFVNLILRLFDIQSGRILIDGQEISRVTQDSLRQAIGMIPQDPSLFHRSLLENIRYGRVEASDEDVIEAARKAHAHDFIIQLPQGYHTLVGERGVKLSGGQRQRIAIARAILKNAPILILDEATSQLDSLTEAHIQESLWALMQGKTTLVVAHRLSTLLHMDRILVFDGGKIVEDGAHEDLLAKGGLYRTLWDAQVGGFLPEAREAG